ncbi:hypothetical protein ADIARSV_2020 [Arcticibacter svalbardensis MN12-7]|uniref:Outer membrane protein beta-barrel domain-containing protein n=1 Tax=Arcticibacter svalbardensis MN12-7 TaxID=1150600 RepID=R9H0Q5_9SPHI|nr:hypothetical protein [Arcticibacter svalbardensis]EOR94804.1 hypothetical protein ADIARSV_2020 [Arcticibacter svalbardensis MN12-7]
MQDNFDKKLSERIQQVFNLYEDDSADLGWKELRKKFPEKKVRSPFIYWLGSAAAVLLLVAGTWALFNQTINDQNINNKDKVHTISKNSIDQNLKNANPVVISDSNLQAKKTVPQPVQATYSRIKQPKFTESAVVYSSIKNIPESISKEYAILDTLITSTNLSIPLNKELATLQERTEDTETYKEPQRQLSAVANDYDELQRAKNAMLTNDKAPIVKVKKDSRLSFSLFAGSHVSYAEGSKSSMNTGVGVSSELGITRNLKFTTGLSLAQNTLKYNKRIPEQVASSFITSSTSRVSNLMVSSAETKTSAVNYSINGYDASLLGLDVPINLKYTVFRKENELYIVAGLSSNFFFDETYTYAYGYNSLEANAFQEHPDETTTTNSSTFDFARMLNLSVGYGYPIGKQSKLSLEPFLKYPLAGLGAQNLRFGAAGLNLKWSFTTR